MSAIFTLKTGIFFYNVNIFSTLRKIKLYKTILSFKKYLNVHTYFTLFNCKHFEAC